MNHVRHISAETNDDGIDVPCNKMCLDGIFTPLELLKIVAGVDGTVAALIAAATPFTDGNIVDETSGTLPLIEELRKAIEAAEKAIK